MRTSSPTAGYEFRFNRDELRSRGEALGPRRHDATGRAGDTVSFLAPVDTDAGGTWIAVNEFGLTVALLNGFRACDHEPRDFTSRGLLVTQLATSTSAADVETALRADDLVRYRSFRLVVLATGPPVFLAEWDGRHLTVEPNVERRLPIVSSSFDETDVGRARRAAFERIVGDPAAADSAALDTYHKSHDPEPSAYSVCMHRPEACTRSLTLVRVTVNEVAIVYTPGPPGETDRTLELRLPRRPEPERAVARSRNELP
jgi:hypothetical protein